MFRLLFNRLRGFRSGPTLRSSRSVSLLPRTMWPLCSLFSPSTGPLKVCHYPLRLTLSIKLSYHSDQEYCPRDGLRRGGNVVLYDPQHAGQSDRCFFQAVRLCQTKNENLLSVHVHSVLRRRRWARSLLDHSLWLLLRRSARSFAPLPSTSLELLYCTNQLL